MAEDIQTYLREQMPVWRAKYPGVEEMRVAVMGCVVNGPGESKHANIGISLPGTSEEPKAPVYVDGKLVVTLRGDGIVPEFLAILEDYVARRYGGLILKGLVARTKASRLVGAAVAALTADRPAREARGEAARTPKPPPRHPGFENGRRRIGSTRLVDPRARPSQQHQGTAPWRWSSDSSASASAASGDDGLRTPPSMTIARTGPRPKTRPEMDQGAGQRPGADGVVSDLWSAARNVARGHWSAIATTRMRSDRDDTIAWAVRRRPWYG